MSSFIKLQNLHFSYDNLSAELIAGISVGFHHGWTSLCGPNGCGKTTLLKLISGELKPNSGSIAAQGSIVAIPQSTEFAPSGLHGFRLDYQKSAIKLRNHLKIGDDWYERWPSLSIGERKRLQIAVALASNPDVLLVDEPTNHVDAETKQVILEALNNFRGVGVIISHDRLLLNELCS
ncbi:MAG: ATP-binding cassette domain-containing protein [Oligoflexales bacterium]